MLHLASFWSTAGDITLTVFAWIFIIALLATGVFGTIFPALPGTVLIFLAAVAHYFLIGPPNSFEILGFTILLILVAISYIIDFLSGAMGAKWFGSSRWGAVGALIGGIVGMFFFPLGLLLGPLAGAVIAEVIFAKRKVKPAAKSGVGTVIGTAAGMVLKLVIAGIMVTWFVFDIFLIKSPF